VSTPPASPPAGPSPEIPILDPEGTFRAWGRMSVAVIGTYVVLLLLIVFVLIPRESASYLWVPYALAAVILLFLVRYFSTHYTIDDSFLRASRLLGGRRVALEEVRRIEYSALRDLAPTGVMAAFGPWGWRGRMWSPVIGAFDSVFTDPANGILVTAADFPLYFSPKDPEAFARELSRRVRSYTGPLEVDVGHPLSG